MDEYMYLIALCVPAFVAGAALENFRLSRAASRAAASATPLDLRSLREANFARDVEWNPDDDLDLSFRACELAGETGEACNVVKKMERERLGLRGTRATLVELADELADVVICADLLAMSAGVDLAAAVPRKFNATSDKYGLSVRMTDVHDQQ